jgi:hypothetical protein
MSMDGMDGNKSVACASRLPYKIDQQDRIASHKRQLLHDFRR